jgi:hypothetical protein
VKNGLPSLRLLRSAPPDRPDPVDPAVAGRGFSLVVLVAISSLQLAFLHNRPEEG